MSSSLSPKQPGDPQNREIASPTETMKSIREHSVLDQPDVDEGVRPGINYGQWTSALGTMLVVGLLGWIVIEFRLTRAEMVKSLARIQEQKAEATFQPPEGGLVIKGLDPQQLTTLHDEFSRLNRNIDELLKKDEQGNKTLSVRVANFEEAALWDREVAAAPIEDKQERRPVEPKTQPKENSRDEVSKQPEFENLAKLADELDKTFAKEEARTRFVSFTEYLVANEKFPKAWRGLVGFYSQLVSEERVDSPDPLNLFLEQIKQKNVEAVSPVQGTLQQTANQISEVRNVLSRKLAEMGGGTQEVAVVVYNADELHSAAYHDTIVDWASEHSSTIPNDDQRIGVWLVADDDLSGQLLDFDGMRGQIVVSDSPPSPGPAGFVPSQLFAPMEQTNQSNESLSRRVLFVAPFKTPPPPSSWLAEKFAGYQVDVLLLEPLSMSQAPSDQVPAQWKAWEEFCSRFDGHATYLSITRPKFTNNRVDSLLPEDLKKLRSNLGRLVKVHSN